MEESNSHFRLIVFDAGHVFIDFDWQEVCRCLVDLSGLSAEEVKHAFSYLETLGYKIGRIKTEDFLFQLNSRLKTKISPDEFPKLWNTSFVENDGVVKLMRQLRQRFPLYLLSNTNEAHYEYLQRKYDSYSFFEQSILSYKVGHAKPEPEIYHEVLRLSGLPANRCLFIDDLPENVQAAEKIGMHAIQFSGLEPLTADLQNLGVL